ncbi:hypothetical protein WR25_09315 [Diploscapter pachys]|uniref:Uncharacterized protein n=1 Tax=Diploscapter pachys TaxID=2018661 RepID=A0A2A2L587_9BILA|nr:hypothetical protein WR25_09315 [Diploscapter pachys]
MDAEPPKMPNVLIIMLILLSLLFSPCFGTLHHLKSGQTKSQCERIQHAFCKTLPYNFTSFPNIVGDESIRIAEDNIQGFEILLNSACSEQLRFFLCSVYFPMCNEKIPRPIGPCRPLCESVQKGCLPLLKDFGFSWPSSINCDKFPAENIDDMMCMKGPNKDGEYLKIAPAQVQTLGSSRMCQPDYVYLNRTGQCVPMCTAPQGIQQADKDSTSTTLFILSVASICLTVLCLIFYVIRPDALTSLSEKSMLWASMAMALSSIIYLLSLAYRNQIACTDYSSHVLFVISPLPHVPCTVVGALLYYFGTVGRLWWCVMCATWNPHTGTAARFEKHRVQVHMLVWSVPLFVVMLALMSRSISADPLSGICLVGQASKVISF